MRLIRTSEERGDNLNDIMRIFPSYALSSGLLYSSSKQLLNETREYTAAEIFNATTSKNAATFEEMLNAIAAMPPRTNITLEPYEMANMGGDVFALGIHCIVFFMIVVAIEYSHLLY